MGLLAAVATTEFVDLSGGVHHFLLAGVEGVAVAAHLDSQVATDRRASLEAVSTAAGDGDLLVLGVDVSFHDGIRRGKRA